MLENFIVTILSLIFAGIFGYLGYIWIVDNSNGEEMVFAWFTAAIFALVGYFLWLTILIFYVGMKLFSFSHLLFMQVVESGYKHIRRNIRQVKKNKRKVRRYKAECR